MKNNNLSNTLMCLFLILSFSASAQLNTPRGSQQASVIQTVGITKIQIDYSRPSVNGREIWGALVPYGLNNLGFGTSTAAPWRAGANENTTIHLSHDVTIGGKSLKAGVYGLHMIVNENNTATVIFSNNSTAWGSYFYEPEEDALRVDVSTKEGTHVEQLTFEFTDVKPNAATAVLKWEKKQIPFTIEVNVPKIVLADIRNKLQNQPGFTRQTWEQAANYSFNNGGDLDEALTWINNAIAGQFYSQKTFNNLQLKSQILLKQGKNEEASSIMDEAIGMANVLQVHQYGRTLIAQGHKEKAMKVFKMNAEKNKDTWPVHYGLARGYSAMGDYKLALTHLRKALNNVPDQPNKDAILANIEKLEKGQDIN